MNGVTSDALSGIFLNETQVSLERTEQSALIKLQIQFKCLVETSNPRTGAGRRSCFSPKGWNGGEDSRVEFYREKRWFNENHIVIHLHQEIVSWYWRAMPFNISSLWGRQSQKRSESIYQQHNLVSGRSVGGGAGLTWVPLNQPGNSASFSW